MTLIWYIGQSKQFWHQSENINNISQVEVVPVVLFDSKDSADIDVD